MSKKTSAVMRIVIYSLLAVFLLGFLVTGLKGNLPFRLPAFSYAGSEEYTAGGGEISAEGIRDIEVNWNSGSVNITVYDGDHIILNESSKDSLEENQRMRYLSKNGKLTIQYCAPFRNFRFWDIRVPDKNLEVKIPKELAAPLAKFEINTTSATVQANGVASKELIIDSVSGGATLENFQTDKLITDTVSGDIIANQVVVRELHVSGVSGSLDFHGEAHLVETDCVSGTVQIESYVCPKKASMSSVSGGVSLTIPEDEGFTAQYDSVSGEFSTEFLGTGGKGKFIYKTEDAVFTFDTVSGDMEIRKISGIES